MDIYKVLKLAKVLNICILKATVRPLPPQHFRQFFILLITEKKCNYFLSLCHDYLPCVQSFPSAALIG